MLKRVKLIIVFAAIQTWDQNVDTYTLNPVYLYIHTYVFCTCAIFTLVTGQVSCIVQMILILVKSSKYPITTQSLCFEKERLNKCRRFFVGFVCLLGLISGDSRLYLGRLPVSFITICPLVYGIFSWKVDKIDSKNDWQCFKQSSYTCCSHSEFIGAISATTTPNSVLGHYW